MRRLIGIKRPRSMEAGGGDGDGGGEGCGGGEQDHRRRTSAPLSSMSGGGGRIGSASSRGTQHDEDQDEEVTAAAADEDSPAMDNTQEVVWRDSPKQYYRSMRRHSTDLVHRELSIIQDMLAGKENVCGYHFMLQQHPLEHQQHDGKMEVGAGIGGTAAAMIVGGRKVSHNGDIDDEDNEQHQQDHHQFHAPSTSFSSSLLRNLLFRKSPAINRHATEPPAAPHPAPPPQPNFFSDSSGKHTAEELVADEAAATAEEGDEGDSLAKHAKYFPSTTAGPTITAATRRASTFLFHSSLSVKSKAAKIGGGNDAGDDGGICGLFGGLARSLRPGRFPKMFQHHAPQPGLAPASVPAPIEAGHEDTQTAMKQDFWSDLGGAGEGKGERGGGEERRWRGQGLEGGGGEREGEEGGGQRFLHILEQIEEKLSQEEEEGGFGVEKREKLEIQEQQHQQQQEIEGEQAKPWDEADDSNLWTENDWAQILQLTQQDELPPSLRPAPPAPPAAPPAAAAAVIAAAAAATTKTPAAAPAPAVAPIFNIRTNPPSTASPAGTQQSSSKEVPKPLQSAPPLPFSPLVSSNPPLPSPADVYSGMEEAGGYSRYLIEGIKDVGGNKQAEAVHLESGKLVKLTIGPPWSVECPPRKGDLVHIVSTEKGKDVVEGKKGALLTVVDRTQNYLILHPDLLVSPSSVISGLQCDRRAVLQFSMSSSSGQSPVTTMGNLKHSFVQATLLLLNERERLLQRLADGSVVEEVERVADHVISRFRVQLYGLRVPEAEARQELLDLIRPLVEWARILYLPTTEGGGEGGGGGGGGGGMAAGLVVERTQHIEESIWSAAYGLKGNIDATLVARPVEPTVQLRQQQQQQQLSGGGEGQQQQQQQQQQQRLFPLELKSGSAMNETEHRGQLMLYSLLLQDRYGHGGGRAEHPNNKIVTTSSNSENSSSNSENSSSNSSSSSNALLDAGTMEMGASRSGVLAYLRTTGVEARLVMGQQSELRQLLIVRNRVAQAFMRAGLNPDRPLPPILAHPSECSKCFQVAECMIYHQAFEEGTAQSSAVGGLFDEITGHLKEADRAYLRKWDRLIGMEENASVRAGRDLWHRRAVVEEKRTARCLSDMVCKEARALNAMDGPAYLYRFARRQWKDAALAATAGGGEGEDGEDIPRSLHEMAIAVGDRVLISTESLLPAQASDRRLDLLPFQHINLTNGNVRAVTETTVDIICSKAIAVPGYADFSFLSFTSSAAAGDGVSRKRSSRGTGAGGLVLAYEDEDGEEERAKEESASRRRDLAEKDVVVFRIDRDNTSLNFTTMRSNVVGLFSGPAQNANSSTSSTTRGNAQIKELRKKDGLRLSPTAGDEKRRHLVVHLQRPVFTQEPYPYPADAVALLRQRGQRKTLGCAEAQLQTEFVQLNHDQQRAVEKVLTAQDFALILGMPGTGKTWTIAFIVRALVLTGKSVLITSYTHTAVDTVLLKLREFQVPFVRLGRAAQVQPALHDSLLEAGDGLRSMATLDAKLGTAQVVATTCLGMRHAALASRRFDVCIVDEAGQILEPVCLGPLRLASSFVLVGDHNQLPPLVVSPQAAEEGMGESLFSRLAHAHPQALQRLTFQYRMNRDIMSVCNNLIYANQLQCGDDRVADATLSLPHFNRLQILRAEGVCAEEENGPGWLEGCFVSHRSVLFLDTDGISPAPLEDGLVSRNEEEETEQEIKGDEAAREGKRCKRKRDRECPSNLTNPTEARLVAQLVTALVIGGVRAERVAVISPLRSQLKLLRRQLQHVKRLEVNTVDKLQGMDRDCVIISMVRSNAEGVIGHLLHDRRRINVAVSRAKKKLIIIGSASTLAKGITTCELVEMMQARKWVLTLPPHAHHLYDEHNLDAISLLSATQ